MDDFFDKQYKSVDLKTNYWCIVGLKTEEDFSLIAKYKLKLLQDCGFNCSKSLFDVGCGTGLLPSVIYKDMTAKYLGIDIMSSAIDYCKIKYTKSNFEFRVNQPDLLTNKKESFDFIVFYSVFTHCYSHESNQLLKQASALLNNGGKIIADFFVGLSKNKSREILTITQLELDTLLKLQSLKHSVISDNIFDGSIRRVLLEMYK